jgi:AcrR family transcriptional regulator
MPTEEPPGEKRLRSDAERNRKRILLAAREVFAERGFAATLDDVAHHAGVGVGTVYRRFPTKEALAEAVFDGRLEEMVQLTEHALEAPSAWDGFTEFLRVSTAQHAADRGLRDVALGAGFGTTHFAKAGEQMKPLVARLVERAQAEGTLRADVTLEDLPMMLLMISEVAHHSEGVRPDVYQRYLELFIDGLRAKPENGNLGAELTHDEVDAMAHQWLPTLDARRSGVIPAKS